MTKSTICLNIIMKNEEHVILEMLESVAPFIDDYVINDTGSTDKSREVVKEFFDARGIKGVILDHEFRTCTCHSGIYKKYSFFHFGWNRTWAIQQAMKHSKSQYLFTIDCDDVFHGTANFNDLVADCYMIKIGNNSFTYPRAQIFKNDPAVSFYFKEPLHEYPTSNKKDHTKAHLQGDYYIESRRLGDRSKDLTVKYANDAKIFEEILLEEPNNERNMFYCAQSYFDAQMFEKSLETYQKRVKMPGWFEETYFAQYKIAECMVKLAHKNASYTWLDIEREYIKAWEICKTHAEPFHHIARHYREINDFKNGYIYAKKSSQIQYPTHDILFIFKDIYDYKAKDELARCAFGLGKYHEAYSITKSILKSGFVQPFDVERIKKLMSDSEKKVNDMQKPNACIYFGNEHIHNKNINNYAKLIDNVDKYYTITIVGNNIVSDDICGNNNILILSTTQLSHLSKTKFNYLILCDYVNYFYDNVNIVAEQNILYLNDSMVKLSLDNNIYVSVYNNTYLNSMFSKIHKIVCANKNVMENFVNAYNLNADDVDYSDEDYHKLFENDKHKYNFKLQINNETNGLIYHEPAFIKNANSAYPYSKDIVVSSYENIIKKFPKMIEHYIKFFNVLYNMGDYNGAQWKLEKAMTLLKNDKSYEPIITLHKAKILFKQNKWEEGYELINNILQKKNVPDSVRETFEDIRDDNIMYFKDNYLTYPLKKIKQMKNGTNNAIVFSITTCKRYDLFEKTINSFLNCCNDSHLIGQWLCVDDNSNEEDRNKMKKNYPFFKFIWKNEEQKGHHISMNIIRDYLLDIGATHVLHCEDDFHYFQKRNYITDSLKILDGNVNDKVGQVLFNRNYSEADFSQRKIKGGFLRTLQDGTRYIIHEHYESGTPEYNDFLNRYKGQGTCAYWEGFSFRPSVLKVSVLRDVGTYYYTDHFERAYAVEYKLRGYKSAFFDAHCCIHIGKKTWESATGGISNSYTLNNMGQFSLNKEIISVNVLNDNNIDMFKKFKEHNKNELLQYSRCQVKQITGLDDFERKVLVGNEFNYLRPIASNALYHINMMRNCKSKNMLFLRDTVRLHVSFKVKLEEYIKSEYDIIVFGDKVSDNLDLDNCYGYLVSIGGMTKIIEHVIKNGIKNMNYLDGIKLNVTLFDKVYDIDNDGLVKKDNNCDNLYKKIDGYKFYCLMDSFGHDVGYVGQKPLDELLKETEKLGGDSFNTLGWIKKGVTTEDQFINLPNSNGNHCGLYVKI